MSLFIDHRREKLLNAISYFSRNTKYCYTLKLFKLLYFLDFEHYRQTGRPVTGLVYRAFPNGPVPVTLYEEFTAACKGETSDLQVRETRDDIGDLAKREFGSKQPLDLTYFSPRELEIMKRLVLFFGEHKADVMSEYSHDPKLPWKKVYGDGKGEKQVIPYELALQSEPLVADAPTIADEEIQMLDDVFQGTGLRE